MLCIYKIFKNKKDLQNVYFKDHEELSKIIGSIVCKMPEYLVTSERVTMNYIVWDKSIVRLASDIYYIFYGGIGDFRRADFDIELVENVCEASSNVTWVYYD